MPVTNAQTNTRIDEIADRIFRISTPVPPNPMLPAGFTFNQFLIVDDEPVMFHTGMRKLFPLVREAVATVMPVEKLRWVSWSHWEVDECGSLADWLAAAPNARPLVGQISGAVNASDADREPRMLADGETIEIGERRVRWHDAHRTCRMDGTRASCSRRPRARCSAATSSRSQARSTHR